MHIHINHYKIQNFFQNLLNTASHSFATEMSSEMNKNCVSIIGADGQYPFFICNGAGKTSKISKTTNGIKQTLYRTFSNKYDYSKCNGCYNRQTQTLYISAINKNDGNKLVIIRSNKQSVSYHHSTIVYETGIISLVYVYNRLYIIYEDPEKGGGVYASHMNFVGDQWVDRWGSQQLCDGCTVNQYLEGGKALNAKQINKKEIIILVNSNKLYHHSFNNETELFDLSSANTKFNPKDIKFRDFSLVYNTNDILFSCSRKYGLFAFDRKMNTMKQYKEIKDKNTKNQSLKQSLKKMCKDRKLITINNTNRRKLLIAGYCRKSLSTFITIALQRVVFKYSCETSFELNMFYTKFTMNYTITPSNAKRITAQLDMQAFE